MGRGSTWGTSPIEGSTHYGWKKASDPLWSLVALWSQQETTHPFHCEFPLEVPWCLMRFLFFSSWLQMAFAGGWSSLVLGNVSDCWSPPPPAVTLPPSEGGRPHQKSFWWWHLCPATDILVLVTDPLPGWNLSPHSVTNLVHNSYSLSLVLVSVWCNLFTKPWKVLKVLLTRSCAYGSLFSACDDRVWRGWMHSRLICSRG